MTARGPSQPDFRALFESVPGLYLVLEPDAPRYTIVAVSDAYARQTLTKREALLGRGLFEVFPDNPDDPHPTAVQNTSASLARVIATRAPDTMAVQRHDIRRPPEQGGGFAERWWSPVNSPVFGPGGELAHIIHSVEDVTGLILLEHANREALRSTEQRLRELFESAPDGIFITGPEGRFTDVNAAGYHLLGYSREELLGRSIVELVPPEDVPRQAAFRRHILEGGREVSEWRLRRKDGTHVPVELSASALPDGRVQGFVRDITERREAEERLRLSEAKFSGIVNIAADAILSIDEEQRITLFNDGAEQIFGYARAEVLGAPLDLLIPQRLRAMHRAHVSAFAAGGATARHMGERATAIVGLRKNGQEFPADAAISQLDLGGRKLLTVALRDATEQKRSEQDERFLANVGAVLATTLDFDETVASITRLALDLADWCSVQIVDDDGRLRRLAVVSADPAKQPLADALQRLPLERNPPHLGHEVMESRASRIVLEVSPARLRAMTQSDEHRRIVEALGVASMMAVPLVVHGQVRGALVAVSSSPRRRFGPSDLRLLEGLGQRAALALENARLYRAQQRAIEARDSVLGIVAHDLRNPLNGIVLQAAMLRRQKPGAEGPGGALRFAEDVTRAAKRMDHLIQDLLDVTRVEAGGLPIACRGVAPGKLLAEAEEAQRLLAEEAGLELRLEIADELPEVWADTERLLQVFGNLMANAFKFSPRGGRITLGATSQGSQVVFRVEDTGSGIAESLFPYLFDRFWQAKRTDRRGAGLGLSIVKGIVEAHGGRVWVESTPGRGSTFFFTIPIAPRAGE